MADERVDAAARRLAAIVDSSDDAIVAKDLNGFIVSWNRAAEQMFGYPADEAIGRHITMIIPHDRLPEEDEVLRRIRNGERVDHFETIRQRKDGSLLPVSLTISPIRDSHGKVIGASKIARDISDRASAARRLASAQATQADLQRRLLALVSASGTLLGTPRLEAAIEGTISLAHELVAADAYAIWRFDAYARAWKVVVSRGLSKPFAISAWANHNVPPEVPFAEPRVLDDVRIAPMSDERRAALVEEGVASLLIVPLVIRGHATGTLAFYSKRRRKFTSVEVETARALGNLAAASITTAELYEEQERSRERADFLVEAGSALASSLDYQETLRTVAGLAVPRIADWCAVDMMTASGEIERVAVAHVDPDKPALARDMAAEGGRPGSPYGPESVIRTGRPAILPAVTDDMLVAAAHGDAERLQAMRALGLVSFMSVPLTIKGRTVGAITFATGRPSRHYDDADLRFAEQVANRAALAVENALSYDEVRQANRLKDEFLATLSHELRTPLNTLLGYARMMQSGVIPADRERHAIDIVERNATSLAQIVADVLDVSRIISGKLRLDTQLVDVGPVVREALETVRPAADAKRIRVETSFESLENVVSADAPRLQQVLWNLLANAVKFTPNEGRISIHVRQTPVSVDIDVTDNGIGIPPDFLPFVFDRFRQADSRFSREHGGLGLGLAIARHIVEMHGGRVEAFSEGPGRGSTFRVSLPNSRPAVETDRSPHPGNGDQPSRRLAGLKVLAVDDQEDALAMLRAILEGAGAQVTTVSAGDEAIRLIEAAPPDVLLADIGMPGMDGLELIRRVRRSIVPAAKRLPAAALTAYVRDEDRSAALESGYHQHVPKPVDPSEVIRIVGSLAGRQPAS
jgi:PAS domain S-box-containing protein